MGLGTEKALDLLPHIVEIYEKMNLDNYIKRTQAQNKGKNVDASQAGIDLFKFIFKNINKAKEEVLDVVAILDDKDVDEIRNQSLAKTIASVKRIFEDKELLELFKSAM